MPERSAIGTMTPEAATPIGMPRRTPKYGPARLQQGSDRLAHGRQEWDSHPPTLAHTENATKMRIFFTSGMSPPCRRHFSFSPGLMQPLQSTCVPAFSSEPQNQPLGDELLGLKVKSHRQHFVALLIGLNGTTASHLGAREAHQIVPPRRPAEITTASWLQPCLPCVPWPSLFWQASTPVVTPPPLTNERNTAWTLADLEGLIRTVLSQTKVGP